MDGLIKLHGIIKEDRRLKMSDNTYRVINKKGNVIFTLTEDQKNQII